MIRRGTFFIMTKTAIFMIKTANPNSDKVVFRPSTADYCVGIEPKAGSYAKTFDRQPVDSDEDNSGSDEPAVPFQVSSSLGSVPEVFTASASCHGNMIWSDFFPDAPNYNARAEIDTMQISMTIDFENGVIESEFCGQGEKPNNGWSQASADFCVTIEESNLYRELDGTWSFDGVWAIDLDMSGAQLHWVGNSEEWAYGNQHSQFEAPFHGWIAPGDGSLYTDEVQPATFQFLCDFIPAEDIFQ